MTDGMSRQVRRQLERQGKIMTVSQVRERDRIVAAIASRQPTYLYPEGWPNDDWTQVELFRLVYGRLPNEPGDAITPDTLVRFGAMFDAGDLSSRTTDLDALRVAVATGKVKCTATDPI